MSKKYTILFVGESAAEEFLIRNIIELDQLPIEPIFISDPEKALLHLGQQTCVHFPDIILADLQLPLYSGCEFAEKYRAAFHYSFPKTLLYITSAHLSMREGEKIIHNDAITGFLPKPFSSTQFFERIQHRLGTFNNGKATFLLQNSTST